MAQHLRLRQIRLDRGLTIEKMAQEMQKSVRQIGSYERGESDPNLDYLYQLCQKYNVNGHWLITGDGPPYLSTNRVKEQENDYNTPAELAELMRENARLKTALVNLAVQLQPDK